MRQATPVGFNIRNAVMIIASQYADINQALLEVVQNILDAESVRCEITVNLNRRTVMIEDDGSGASIERMRETISNIAESRKTDERPWGDQPFGRYGIGILAFANKVNQTQGAYTIVTGPRTGRGEINWEGMTKWSFTELIRGTDVESVFSEQDEQMTSQPEWWSTRIEVAGLSDGQIRVFNLDKVLDGLQRFGSVIDHCQITIKVYDRQNRCQEPVTFVRKQYSGRPLPLFTITGPDCGVVQFQLFFTESAVTKNRLSLRVGDCAQLIPWVDVCRQVEETVDAMHSDALAVLNSNHFQGEIVAARGDMEPQRNRLVTDAAFLDLICVLEGWALSEGRELLDQVTSSNAIERREAGLEAALGKIAPTLRLYSDKMGAALRALGTSVTHGHVDPPDGKPTDRGRERRRARTADKPETPTTLGEAIKQVQQEQPNGSVKPPNERTGVIHLSYVSADGSDRVVSKGDRGMRFRYDELQGSPYPFAVLRNEGLVAISTRHPVFAYAEAKTRQRTGIKRRDYTLQRYLEMVVQLAVVLLLQPEDSWEEVLAASDSQVRLWQMINETPDR